jgi:hypothetical protein
LKSFALEVARWAALVDSAELGAAATEAVIPGQQRRRLPRFSRDVLRCALPLLETAPAGTPVILASPHGDLASTVTLLTSIAHRETPSPSLFGLSVHNAAIGAMSLCIEQPGDQTALAGDTGTFSAGLIEAYARLASREAQSIMLIHADERLPPTYAEFDSDTPSVVLAMTLHLAPASDANAATVGADRAGALAVIRALEAGQSRLAFNAQRRQAQAA